MFNVRKSILDRDARAENGVGEQEKKSAENRQAKLMSALPGHHRRDSGGGREKRLTAQEAPWALVMAQEPGASTVRRILTVAEVRPVVL